MLKGNILANDYAVSEVIGATLLVLIAVIAAVSIYSQMLPVPIPPPEPNVKLMGYVTENGEVIIEHMGGEILNLYEVYVDGTSVYTNPDGDYLDIGGTIPSSIAPTLFDENYQVRIAVYALNDDSTKSIVFDGIFIGPEEQEEPPEIPHPIYSMPISTLRTNSVDEDIICYSSFITPNIDPVISYIYNWMVDRGEGFSPITSLLMPFDTNNEEETRDYSENNPSGTIYGATWLSNGVVGGAYSFDGEDYISLPYCFDEDVLNKITVEAWLKTSEMSGTIVSYERNNYWELSISGGVVKWTTNASDGTVDVNGIASINDDMWHYIATTYNSSTGDCNIYVDGLLDTTENAHISGEVLGSGDTPIGFIGKGTGSANRETIFSTGFETQEEKNFWSRHNYTEGGDITWDTLGYEDFNAGYGSYTDGGSDCTRRSDYKYEGSYSVRLRDNSDSSRCTLTNGIDVQTPEYTSIKVDFWWMWRGNYWNSGEDWWVRYYDGGQWRTVLDRNYPDGFSKNTWYHEIVYINESDYNFPSNMRIRFQCDASSDYDEMYIDHIYINATGGDDRVEYDFDLRDFTALDPHAGDYSIGGTGDFDPDFAFFNRTIIDISEYTEVRASVWYSYDSTESEDEVGLYYKDGDSWIPIFEELEPQIGNGNQLDWTYVDVQIPEYIDDLEFQFMWSTSSTSEYVAIDYLEITGIPPSGENNFTGLIDELKIFNDVLSPEQIYQNYLQSKDGDSSRSVIVSEETAVEDCWKCIVTPNNGIQDDVSTESDVLYVISYDGGEQ